MQQWLRNMDGGYGSWMVAELLIAMVSYYMTFGTLVIELSRPGSEADQALILYSKMSAAREDVARIAPGMSDEDLARLLQLEEERAYQQQLAGLAESLQYRVSISSKFQSSSTSPSSSSGRPVAGKFGPRKPGRSPGNTLSTMSTSLQPDYFEIKNSFTILLLRNASVL